MPDERRADDSVRLRKFIEVVIEDKLSFTLFRGTVADISVTGMRVISEQYLPKGTRYVFTMKRAPSLTTKGDVRWVRAFERDTFQVGIEFTEMSEDDRVKLKQFVEIERQRVPTS